MISEAERLAELARFAVLDTPPEPAFDELVSAAAEASGCPTALVSLLDVDRQWFKARHGMDVTETPRAIAFCEQALQADAPLVVPDARADPRFAGNPSVTEPGGVRFYAGFPLRASNGAVLGTLCVVGNEPRPEGLTDAQSRILAVLADQVMAQLELRRALAETTATQERLEVSERRFKVLFDENPVGQVELSADGVVQRVNRALATLLGVSDPAQLIGATPAWATPEQDRPAQEQLIRQATSGPGQVLRSERTIHRADGTPIEIEGTVVAVPGEDGAAEVLIGSVVDVTEHNRAQRLLAETADQLSAARDEAVRRNALTETVLDTVGVGIVACDAEGHLTLFNRATREFHGIPEDPTADPADWAHRYALYAEDGQTLLTHDQIPLVRALTSGSVDNAVIVIAPEGLPVRVVRCDGRALYDPDGRLLGAVAVMSDITTTRAVERRLAEQADFTRALLETAHTAIWSCDTTGKPTSVNAIARELLGWPALDDLISLHEKGELDSLANGVALVHPDGEALTPQERPLRRALSGEDTGEVEVVFAAPGRPRRTLLLRASPLRDGEGEVSGAILTGHDVTALRASEARFRAAFQDGPTPSARLDRDGVAQDINPALRRLLARKSQALLGRPLAEHVVEEDRRRLQRVLHGSGTGTEPVEIRLLRAGGQPVWCELATTVTTGSDGEVFVLAQFLDIDARKSQEHALEQAAQSDPLTGLGNRSQLHGRIQALLDAGAPLTAGLLFVDLDDFKTINDEHGHEAGDAVLVTVADRLVAAVRPDDAVLRLGGDEFVIVCPVSIEGAEGPLQDLARRLDQALTELIPFRDVQLRVGASIGTALATAGQTPGELVEAADRAMYERKRDRAGQRG